MQLNVLDMSGKEVGKIKLSDAVFAKEYNESLIHQVVVAQLANKRQGTMSALTRSEVAGGGAKPFRQKGTGRARQGSSRAGGMVGGGVIFAKKPRDFSKKINKGMKREAFLSAISQKIRNDEVLVLDSLKLDEGKTKLMKGVVEALKLTGSTIFVIDGKDELVYRAVSNLQNVQLRDAASISVYDVVSIKNLVLTKDAAAKIEEANK